MRILYLLTVMLFCLASCSDDGMGDEMPITENEVITNEDTIEDEETEDQDSTNEDTIEDQDSSTYINCLSEEMPTSNLRCDWGEFPITDSIFKLEEYFHFINDYCIETITMVNDQGEELLCTIESKNNYVTTIISIPSGGNAVFCINTQIISHEIISERFEVKAKVENSYYLDNYLDEFSIENLSIFTQLSLSTDILIESGVNGNIWRPRSYIGVILKTITGPEVSSLSSFVSHDSITINNSTFFNVYSNLDSNCDFINAKCEKLYYHLENGLVAVTDTLGTTWTRK